MMYENAFGRYSIEKEQDQEVFYQCEIDRPVFESDVVDRIELASKQMTRTLNDKNVKLKTESVKSAMTKKPAHSSTRRWSGLKTIGLGKKESLKKSRRSAT